MTASRTCPDDSVLDALVAGQLEGDMAGHWTTHIDVCRDCQQRLSEHGSSHGIEAHLPQLGSVPTDSSHLQEAVKNIKRMRAVDSTQEPDETKELQLQNAADATGFTRDGFELLGVIGRGGMGVVYLARESSLERTVAVKVLSPLLASETSARQRFLREARSAAAVVHPNVVTIHAVSDKPPLPYLVMEYIEGVSLQQQLDRGGEISIDNVIRIGRQLCAALAAAQAKGVVHRDIKPANIMLNAKTGKVLLGDFGLARAAENSRLTRTGTIVGTPSFVAPETLISENAADHRSDLFSLGVVLYALCTGDSPFQSDSLLGTLHRVSSITPERLSDRATHVPAWLSDVIMRLLSKNPIERYQSAIEVREALNGPAAEDSSSQTALASKPALNGSSYPHITVNSKDRSASGKSKGRPASRRPNPFLAIGIFGILIGVLGGIAFMNRNQEARESENEPVAGPDENFAPVALPHERDLASGAGTPSRIAASGNWHLVDSAGTLIQRYEDPELAIEHAIAGTTIQIHSNETIDLEHYSIHLHDVSIVAAQGFSPTLRFRSDSDSDDEMEAMLVVEGSVSLAGLELRLATGDADEPIALISVCENAALQLADCRLLVEDSGFCLTAEATAKLALDRCHLHAPHAAAIGLVDDETGEVSVNRSWITGEIGIETSDPSWQNLTLRDSRMVCVVAFQMEPEVIDEDTQPNTLHIESSTLFAVGALLQTEDGPLDAESTGKLLNIVGQDNTFSGSLFPSSDPAMWQKELAAQQSRVVENPFSASVDEIEARIQQTTFPEFQ